MAYPTLALHLLISAPEDVPVQDMATIRKTISQWNLNLGRVVGLTVLPVSWTEHAVAEFGDRPQAILNDQIVEESEPSRQVRKHGFLCCSPWGRQTQSIAWSRGSTPRETPGRRGQQSEPDVPNRGDVVEWRFSR